MTISYSSKLKKHKKQLFSFLLTLVMCINFLPSITYNISADEMNTTTSTYGDINQDGKINTIDLILLKGFIVKAKSINERYADLDGDGTIKVVDIVLLKQYLLGKITLFPIQETIDTDGDGLTDYIEINTTHTDPKNSDSDGDNLSDYDEIYITGTDPNLLDTNKNNITDGDEDIDNDGLSNLKEIELGTNPLVADSDFDGLSDFEEVKTYHTNPNKLDSDDDGICDGDEIKVSLDPNVSQTNGCPDNEYVFEQKINADDTFFDNINKDSCYNLSIDVTAAGYAKSALSVSESKYTNTIANDAIIGTPLDFSYNENLSFKNMTITFDLSKYNILENLENYMVFEYNEDVNEIFPLETNYDIENNTISCNINQLGTFCVVNINTWALMYGIDEYSDDSSLQNLESIKLNATDSNGVEVIDNAEVVFLVDASAWLNYQEGKYCTMVKNSILNSSKNLFNNSNHLKIMIYEYYDNIGSYITLKNNGQRYATNYEELEEMVNNISAMSANEKNSFIVPLNILIDKQGYSIFNSNNRFVFDYIGSSFVYSTYYNKKLDINGVLNPYKDKLANNNVHLSIVAGAANSYDLYESIASAVKTFCESIENNPGTYLKLGDATSQDIFNHVYNNSAKVVKNVTASGGMLSLKSMISNDPNACADSDSDGINDYYEVNFHSKYWMSKFDANGLLIFPKYSDVFNNIYKINKNIGGYNTLQHRLFKLYPNGATSFCNDQKVLPTLSSLNQIDTDADGETDSFDPHPLKYQLNDTFISNASILYDLANDFQNEYTTLNNSKYSNNGSTWLVFMFIRYFRVVNNIHRYCVGNWPGVGGNLNQDFVDYVKDKNSELYLYFENTPFISSSPNQHDIDLYHMAATISAIIYKSDSNDGFEQGIMAEKHLDNLAGWAGDLQTLVRDCALYCKNNNTTFENYFVSCLGDNNSRCGIMDLKSDADAVNITFNMFSTPNKSFNQILTDYYSQGFDYRFTSFKSNALNNTDKTIEVYTNKKYIVVTWPIYDEDKDTDEYVDITSDISSTSKDRFWNYIINLSNKEKQK